MLSPPLKLELLPPPAAPFEISAGKLCERQLLVSYQRISRFSLKENKVPEVSRSRSAPSPSKHSVHIDEIHFKPSISFSNKESANWRRVVSRDQVGRPDFALTMIRWGRETTDPRAQSRISIKRNVTNVGRVSNPPSAARFNGDLNSTCGISRSMTR